VTATVAASVVFIVRSARVSGRSHAPPRMSEGQGVDSMRLGPGLHRIGSDVVNSYFVEEAAGITIIDAGLPGHWRELTTAGSLAR
jgi:hypothetical protein